MYPGELAALLLSPLTSSMLTDEDVANVKMVLPVAATIPASMEEDIKRVFPSAVVGISYGTSELGLVTRGITNRNIGSVMEGCVLKVRIVNTV